jgi:type III secretory pathway component EscS
MGRISLMVGLLFLMLSDASAATTVDDAPFATIGDALTAWLSGSLGYVIALLGIIGTLIWYALHLGRFGSGTHVRGLLGGMFLSLLLGGLIGIVQTMTRLGSSTFG